MFPSPITGMKLRRARAKGGSFYYCPESSGQLLTLVMAKHFLGADGAREIWVRAEISKVESPTVCPSCAKMMRLVQEPKWLGGQEIDVCRRCHLIWIDGQKHVQNVPTAADFIVAQGDSTIVGDVGKLQAELELAKEMQRFQNDSIAGPVSEDLNVQLRGFVGLPVEIHDRKAPEHVWGTGFVVVSALLIFLFATDRSVVEAWGFYPVEPLRNLGLNMITSVFLHGGWFHVLFNTYFFAIFSDDVEESLGFWKYVFFFIASAIFCGISATFISGAAELPHIGLSGVVMAMLAFYALEFPTTRVGYHFPTLHTISPYPGAKVRMVGSQWLRIPIWAIAVIYFVMDLGSYFLFERAKMGQVAHSMHLAGTVAGAVLWVILARPKKSPTTSRAIVVR